jgi:hypothetical protein
MPNFQAALLSLLKVTFLMKKMRLECKTKFICLHSFWFKWRHDNQNEDTQHNDTQNYDNQHNVTQHISKEMRHRITLS